MLPRRTQTASFWRDQFKVSNKDLDFIYNLVLNAASPMTMTTSLLALQLIQEYQRRETARMESELAKGKIYQPQSSYELGQILVFPAMDFSVGEVLETRPGQNPEHGPFDVIQVRFADSGETREFAANLHTAHRLNASNGQTTGDEGTLLSAQEIYSLYQDEIEESLLFALEDSERSHEFVQVDDFWLLSDMLADIHVGHLNIAEALIEMKGQPLRPEELLAEFDLQAEEISAAMQVISVNHTLASDKRFDNVRTDTAPLWFLTRLEPPEALQTPPLLRPAIHSYQRTLLSVELLQLEWELDDEWGESNVIADSPTSMLNTSFTLIFPHWLYGTLPLSNRSRGFFPQRSQGRSMVTITDGRWGTRYTAWVVHEGRYIYGLKEWMTAHNLPVSARITLERTNKPDEVVIDYRPRRMKREWSRIAKVDPETMTLSLEMNKIQIACEYDEDQVVSCDDQKGLERYNAQLNHNDTSLAAIVEMIVPEIAKLNPQGTAHVKTIYSAINMVWRCPPGPIFYALISNRRFRDTGGGFFAVEW